MPPRRNTGTTELPAEPWAVFRDRLATHSRSCGQNRPDPDCPAWHQGEHLSLIGPTGAGKTTLAVELLELRAWVVALATKPRDRTMDRLIRERRWKLVREWPPPPRAARVVAWPKLRRPEDVTTQAVVFDRLLRDVFVAGGWTVFADELRTLCLDLRLRPLLELLWTNGRALGITVVGGTQRPAHVPLLMYDQATHLFFWRDNDEANLKRIGGLGYLDARLVRDTVAALPRHHALYINTRTGTMLTTVVNR